jgi:hypothetical protein
MHPTALTTTQTPLCEIPMIPIHSHLPQPHDFFILSILRRLPHSNLRPLFIQLPRYGFEIEVQVFGQKLSYFGVFVVTKETARWTGVCVVGGVDVYVDG